MISDHNENKVTQYLIPANVSTKFEIFSGFGWSEVAYVVIAIIIGVIIFFLTGTINMTVQKNINDLSVMEQMEIQEDNSVKIEGDIVTMKKQVLPSPVRFFFIIIPTAITFFVVRRDPLTGMSLKTSIKSAREFHAKQKRYLFQCDSGGR